MDRFLAHGSARTDPERLNPISSREDHRQNLETYLGAKIDEETFELYRWDTFVAGF